MQSDQPVNRMKVQHLFQISQKLIDEILMKRHD